MCTAGPQDADTDACRHEVSHNHKRKHPSDELDRPIITRIQPPCKRTKLDVKDESPVKQRIEGNSQQEFGVNKDEDVRIPDRPKVTNSQSPCKRKKVPQRRKKVPQRRKKMPQRRKKVPQKRKRSNSGNQNTVSTNEYPNSPKITMIQPPCRRTVVEKHEPTAIAGKESEGNSHNSNHGNLDDCEVVKEDPPPPWLHVNPTLIAKSEPYENDSPSSSVVDVSKLIGEIRAVLSDTEQHIPCEPPRNENSEDKVRPALSHSVSNGSKRHGLVGSDSESTRGEYKIEDPHPVVDKKDKESAQAVQESSFSPSANTSHKELESNVSGTDNVHSCSETQEFCLNQETESTTNNLVESAQITEGATNSDMETGPTETDNIQSFPESQGFSPIIEDEESDNAEEPGCNGMHTKDDRDFTYRRLHAAEIWRNGSFSETHGPYRSREAVYEG